MTIKKTTETQREEKERTEELQKKQAESSE